MDRREFFTFGMKFSALTGLSSILLGAACSSENPAAQAAAANDNVMINGNAENPVIVKSDELPFKKVVKNRRRMETNINARAI